MRPFAIAVLALLLGLPASIEAQNLPRCNVGADPVNPNRQLTADEELVSNPADKAIRYESGQGRRSVACILQAGVPVVVDKATGIAKWVYGCGNDILTPWAPKRPSALVRADPVGIAGAVGPTGPTGPQGEQGERGARGARGSAIPAIGVAVLGAVLGYFLLKGKGSKEDGPRGPDVTTGIGKPICTGIGC